MASSRLRCGGVFGCRHRPRCDEGTPGIWTAARATNRAMTDQLSNQPEVPLSQARRVDHVCDRFEAQWQAGTRPQIEAALSDVPPNEQDGLMSHRSGDAQTKKRLAEIPWLLEKK